MYRGRVARDQELFKIFSLELKTTTEKFNFTEKELIPLLISSKTSKDIKVNKQTKMDE